MDILGRSSGVVAPHGLCSLWMPNEKEIHGDSSYQETGAGVSLKKNESDESTPVYLLAFHVKYVTSRLHLEENSDSIRWRITPKQRKTKQVMCLRNYPVMPSIF